MAATEAQFHVLAVDDSLIDRKLIERLLKTSSYQVTTVDSGSKALEFLGWNEDERANSNEAFISSKNEQESSILKNIPVVIMSSENVPSRINRCLEEGAEEFFLKPVRLSDVNKLKPHMMKAKSKDIQKPEKQEKQENNESTEEASSEIQLQTQQSHQTAQSNNKRKSMDDGPTPDRTRPRYSGFTVMSN
ncbi:hypothetical protein DH2020_016602 [Rehmannia glutinosa]|uniref:Response regulatory domain-containing protein n=1 Tax=Rehmannia glutinosa TaxID=99300 RepID=A0ABR0WNS5_REHGL